MLLRPLSLAVSAHAPRARLLDCRAVLNPEETPPAVPGRGVLLEKTSLGLGRSAGACRQPGVAGDPKPPGLALAFVVGVSLLSLSLALASGT